MPQLTATNSLRALPLAAELFAPQRPEDRLGIVQSTSKPERSEANITSSDDETGIVQITQQIALKRRGVETRMIVEDQQARKAEIDQTLIDMMARAHLGLNALTDGSERGVAKIAVTMEMDASDLSRIFPLAFLSPKITEAILAGRQPQDLTLRKLTRSIELPVDWSKQNELLAG